VVFNNNAHDLSGGLLAATPENVKHMTRVMENYSPNGGTNLYSGLQKSMKQLDADHPAAIILVTDGVANVGVTEKKSFIKLLEKNDVRLFTFIMGNNANRPLLKEMTEVSNGFAVSVSNSDDIIGKILEATSKMTHNALRNIELKISGVHASDISPEKIGSIYRGEQITVFGHYHQGGSAKIELSGKVGAEDRYYTTTVDFPEIDESYPELERLWAYGTIETLQNKLDYYGADADTEQAITDVAKQFGLVTNYTSMLIVREDVFQQLNIDRSNQKRVEKEQKAREQRKQEHAQSTRADQQQPMFNSPRPSLGGGGGGGGSSELWMILGMLGLLGMTRLKRAQH
jgi:Ca-activated chloride channel family protein